MKKRERICSALLLMLIPTSLFSLSSCNATEKLGTIDIGLEYTEKYVEKFLTSSDFYFFYQFHNESQLYEVLNDKERFVVNSFTDSDKISPSFFEENCITMFIIKHSSSDIFECSSYEKTKLTVNYCFKNPHLSTDDYIIGYIFNIVPTNQQLNCDIKRY